MFEQRNRFQTAFEDSNEGFDDFEQAIPLMSEEEEKKLTESEIPDTLPILPLKNTVLFPGVVVPITVGRDRSLALVKPMKTTKQLVLSHKKMRMSKILIPKIFLNMVQLLKF